MEEPQTKLALVCSTTRSHRATIGKLMEKTRKRIKKIDHNIKKRITQVQKLFFLINTLPVHRVQQRITLAIILKSQRISTNGKAKQANSWEFNLKLTL